MKVVKDVKILSISFQTLKREVFIFGMKKKERVRVKKKTSHTIIFSQKRTKKTLQQFNTE